MRFWVILYILCLLSGCADGGRLSSLTVEYQAGEQPMDATLPDGKTVTVPPGGRVRYAQDTAEQPDNPTEAATLARAADGAVEISTGSGTGSSVLGMQSWILTIGGIIICLAGIGVIVFRQRVPLLNTVVPKKAGPLLLLLGAGMIATPYVLEQYGWIIGASLGAVAVIGIAYLVFRLAKAARQDREGLAKVKKEEPDVWREKIAPRLEAHQDEDVKVGKVGP